LAYVREHSRHHEHVHDPGDDDGEPAIGMDGEEYPSQLPIMVTPNGLGRAAGRSGPPWRPTTATPIMNKTRCRHRRNHATAIRCPGS
jgi:hypothetical protein